MSEQDNLWLLQSLKRKTTEKGKKTMNEIIAVFCVIGSIIAVIVCTIGLLGSVAACIISEEKEREEREKSE